MADQIQQFMDNNVCTKVDFIAKGRSSPYYNNAVPKQDMVIILNELNDTSYSFGLSYLTKPVLGHLVGKSFEQCRQYLEHEERQAYEHQLKHKVRKSYVTFGTYTSSGRNYD